MKDAKNDKTKSETSLPERDLQSFVAMSMGTSISVVKSQSTKPTNRLLEKLAREARSKDGLQANGKGSCTQFSSRISEAAETAKVAKTDKAVSCIVPWPLEGSAQSRGKETWRCLVLVANRVQIYGGKAVNDKICI